MIEELTSEKAIEIVFKKINKEPNTYPTGADIIEEGAWTGDSVNIMTAAITMLEACDYITKIDVNKYKLTKSGYEVIRAGGWIKYQRRITAKKIGRTLNIVLTLILLAVGTLWQFESKSKDDLYNEITRLKDSIDHIQKQKTLEMHQPYLQLDHSKNEELSTKTDTTYEKLPIGAKP